MIAAALVAAILASLDQDPVQAALTRRDYAEGLAAAAHLADPASRVRGEVEVRYHAGDLGGAHAAARRGVDEHLRDAALALRYAELSATLRDVAGARRGAEQLASILSTSPPGPAEAPAWHTALERRRDEVRELERAATESQRALELARLVATALGVAGVGVLFALAWRERASTRRAT